MIQRPTSRSAHRHRAHGQSMVEFALVISLLLLIAIAIVDFGRAIYAYSVVANSAREGARFGIISPYDHTGIANVVNGAAVGLDRSRLSVSVNTTYNTVQVSVSYDFRLITPLVANVVGGSFTLATSATMYTGH